MLQQELETRQVALPCYEVWGGSFACDQLFSVPGLDAWLYSRPYADHDHGGDIFYVTTCIRGKLTRFAIADVSGHGELVADVSRKLRGLMKRYINSSSQVQLAGRLNQQFMSFSEDGRFATTVLGTYNAVTDHFMLINAGHPPPLWYRHEQDEWEFISPFDASDPRDPQTMSNLPFGLLAEDDTTILFLHHNASDPPQQSVGQVLHNLGRMFGLVRQ